MADDALLDRLTADLKPARHRRIGRDAALLAVVALIELALYVGMGHVRPDMPMAIDRPALWWKLASLALISLVGGWTAIRSFDPLHSPRRGLRALVVLVLAAIATGWAIDVARGGIDGLAARIDWRHGLDCVIAMVILSIPPVLCLGVLMRRGAATDRSGSALATGIASAAWGAFVFAFQCPSDDPFYIMMWYVAGCGVTVAAVRALMPMATRW